MFSHLAYAGTLPLAATDMAQHWDMLYDCLVWLSLFFFVLIIGGMLVFIVKYRHRAGQKPKYITGSSFLEWILVLVPTALLMLIFAWGYWIYDSMTETPSNAYEIHVLAKQWVWTFQYDDGRTTTAEVYVPLNRPVRMIMTSQDVIHSFFVPNFRLKQDVVPGMYTSVWFEARIPGRHQIFCAEYCGTSHSGMLAQMIVLTPPQWKAWNEGKKLGPIPDARDVASGKSRDDLVLAGDDRVTSSQAAPRPAPVLTLAQQGKNLFVTKGCISCHSVDGTPGIGPSPKGIFGQMAELSDGREVLRDENYLRESIVKPNAKIVMGYQPIMPTFQGELTEPEMTSLIAYIKSLK